MIAPIELLPILRVPAVMLVMVAAGTVNVPRPPFSPIVVAFVLGNRVTVPVPAFSAPEVFRFTEAALTFIGELVVETAKVFETLSAPAPTVMKVTPKVELIFPLTVMAPPAVVVAKIWLEDVTAEVKVRFVLLVNWKRLKGPDVWLKFNVPVLVN